MNSVLISNRENPKCLNTGTDDRPVHDRSGSTMAQSNIKIDLLSRLTQRKNSKLTERFHKGKYNV